MKKVHISLELDTLDVSAPMLDKLMELETCFGAIKEGSVKVGLIHNGYQLTAINKVLVNPPGLPKGTYVTGKWKPVRNNPIFEETEKEKSGFEEDEEAYSKWLDLLDVHSVVGMELPNGGMHRGKIVGITETEAGFLVSFMGKRHLFDGHGQAKAVGSPYVRIAPWDCQ